MKSLVDEIPEVMRTLRAWDHSARKRGIPTDPLDRWRFRVERLLSEPAKAHPFPTDCAPFVGHMQLDRSERPDLHGAELDRFRGARQSYERWYQLVEDDWIEHRQLLLEWAQDIHPREAERESALRTHLLQIERAYRQEPVPWWPPYTDERHSILVAMRRLAEHEP